MFDLIFTITTQEALIAKAVYVSGYVGVNSTTPLIGCLNTSIQPTRTHSPLLHIDEQKDPFSIVLFPEQWCHEF